VPGAGSGRHGVGSGEGGNGRRLVAGWLGGWLGGWVWVDGCVCIRIYDVLYLLRQHGGKTREAAIAWHLSCDATIARLVRESVRGT